MPTIKDIAPESVFTIELNAGTPGRQGPKGEQGIQGIQGPKGEPGPKPIRGIDYFTQQDISNMVTTVTGNSNSAFNENVSAKTKEFNANVSAKTSAFDNNAMLKTEEFNANANSKKTDFNLNANNRTTEFNTNASNKKNEIDTYVTNKTTEFDKHVENKVNEFKEETSEYVTENELESKGYLVESDLNDYAKEKDLFSGSYNDLKDKPKIPSKTSELTNDRGFINAIPSEYVTEEEQEEFIKPYNKRITENEKYISDLEATIDILTNTNKAKGELVHITDALPLATFETKASGNVEQETTKGNQLFDCEDIENTTSNITINKEGWVTATLDNTNGTRTKWVNYWTNVSNKLKTSTSYKIVVEVKNISGTFKEFAPVSINTSKDSQFTTQQLIVYSKLTNNTIYLFDNTTKDDFTNSTNMLRSFIAFDAGESGSITFRLSVLEDTTVTPETFVYEKFTNGASPNPEFPSEIEVLEGDLSFKVNGKNLLNVDVKKNTYNGIEFTPIYKDNGTLDYINVNGTATSDTYLRVHQIERYDIDKQKTYIINGSPSGGSTKTYGMVTYYYDENNTYINGVYEFGNGVQIPQSAKLNVNIFVKSGVTMNNAKFYPMLRLASDTDDTYEPYKEQIVYLDLKGNKVVKGDNIIIDKKGNVSLVKNWVKADLNDTNVNKKITEYDGLYWVGIKKPTNSKMLNNFVRYKMFVNCAYYSGTREAVYSYQTGIGGLEWGIIVNSTDTIEDIRPKILGGYYYYELAKPQIINLGTLEEPIKTFEGVNNIQLLANLDTEIEVKYALDVKKYYDNKLAEISAQII